MSFEVHAFILRPNGQQGRVPIDSLIMLALGDVIRFKLVGADPSVDSNLRWMLKGTSSAGLHASASSASDEGSPLQKTILTAGADASGFPGVKNEPLPPGSYHIDLGIARQLASANGDSDGAVAAFSIQPLGINIELRVEARRRPARFENASPGLEEAVNPAKGKISVLALRGVGGSEHEKAPNVKVILWKGEAAFKTELTGNRGKCTFDDLEVTETYAISASDLSHREDHIRIELGSEHGQKVLFDGDTHHKVPINLSAMHEMQITMYIDASDRSGVISIRARRGFATETPQFYPGKGVIVELHSENPANRQEEVVRQEITSAVGVFDFEDLDRDRVYQLKVVDPSFPEARVVCSYKNSKDALVEKEVFAGGAGGSQQLPALAKFKGDRTEVDVDVVVDIPLTVVIREDGEGPGLGRVHDFIVGELIHAIVYGAVDNTSYGVKWEHRVLNSADGPIPSTGYSEFIDDPSDTQLQLHGIGLGLFAIKITALETGSGGRHSDPYFMKVRIRPRHTIAEILIEDQDHVLIAVSPTRQLPVVAGDTQLVANIIADPQLQWRFAPFTDTLPGEGDFHLFGGASGKELAIANSLPPGKYVIECTAVEDVHGERFAISPAATFPLEVFDPTAAYEELTAVLKGVAVFPNPRFGETGQERNIPLSGAIVTIVWTTPDGVQSDSATTDGDGAFTFGDLQTSFEYTVKVTHSRYEHALVTYDYYADGVVNFVDPETKQVKNLIDDFRARFDISNYLIGVLKIDVLRGPARDNRWFRKPGEFKLVILDHATQRPVRTHDWSGKVFEGSRIERAQEQDVLIPSTCEIHDLDISRSYRVQIVDEVFSDSQVNFVMSDGTRKPMSENSSFGFQDWESHVKTDYAGGDVLDPLALRLLFEIDIRPVIKDITVTPEDSHIIKPQTTIRADVYGALDNDEVHWVMTPVVSGINHTEAGDSFHISDGKLSDDIVLIPDKIDGAPIRSGFYAVSAVLSPHGEPSNLRAEYSEVFEYKSITPDLPAQIKLDEATLSNLEGVPQRYDDIEEFAFDTVPQAFSPGNPFDVVLGPDHPISASAEFIATDESLRWEWVLAEKRSASQEVPIRTYPGHACEIAEELPWNTYALFCQLRGDSGPPKAYSKIISFTVGPLDSGPVSFRFTNLEYFDGEGMFREDESSVETAGSSGDAPMYTVVNSYEDIPFTVSVAPIAGYQISWELVGAKTMHENGAVCALGRLPPGQYAVRFIATNLANQDKIASGWITLQYTAVSFEFRSMAYYTDRGMRSVNPADIRTFDEVGGIDNPVYSAIKPANGIPFLVDVHPIHGYNISWELQSTRGVSSGDGMNFGPMDIAEGYYAVRFIGTNSSNYKISSGWIKFAITPSPSTVIDELLKEG